MKFRVPEVLSYLEVEKLQDNLYDAVIPILDKIAIEHNNILTYIKDKEKIVFDGNVHKYSYFLYELEKESLEKSKQYLSKLNTQYYRLEDLSVTGLLLPGDYGTWENDPQSVGLWERAQAGIISDMLSRGHIDRIVKVILGDYTYQKFYVALYDGMLAAGYNFPDKTIRKMAAEIFSGLENQLSEYEVGKPDISKPIPEKHYKPSPFRKTPKVF